MTTRQFAAALLAIALLALTLRAIFPAADPPWRPTVGIVWHDEGAWTHNARNKALFGAWRLDNWNPVYIAPVFTALEYAAFEAFGVGLRQARLVSQLAGFASVVLLALGVRRLGGNAAGVIAAGLLSTNYVYVMYGRAALMESLMVAFIVASWYCSSRAEMQPFWGALAGLCATLAFFTKASAVFYLGALGMVAASRVIRAFRDRPREGGSYLQITNDLRGSLWTFAGLALSFALIAVFFVLPHWQDYQFYNWQMSVTRKPSYDIASLMTRLSWFPVIHDTFSRMWFALCLGLFGAWGIAARWREAGDAERLLMAWFAIGSFELLLHDVGNERRFVFLIPALVALASLVLARGTLLPIEAARVTRTRLLLAAPALLYSAYVLLGPLTRLPFLEQIRSNVFRMPVRLAAAAAIVLTAALVFGWARSSRVLTAVRWNATAAGAFLGLAMAWHLVQFVDWARYRTYENYAASLALGRVLPPGTAVQGKLANGLALENQIRPIFIGHAFGNYADRKDRWDVRYILTYTDPEIGYEGDQILDVLAAYPGWRIIMTFDVAETRSGHDTAALIEKRARD